MPSSLWLVGFAPPDEEWQKMADVFFACQRAGIDPPPQVEAYFEDGAPEEHGKQLILNHLTREHSAEMQWGLEIEVDKIPKDVKLLRFHVSY